MRLCAISVDLDEIPCYAAIHGLPLRDSPENQAIYRAALPRFEALFDELSLRATFFVVGSDLAQTHVTDAVRRLAGAAHEIGNHTQDHRYALTRGTREQMHAQVVSVQQQVVAITGRAPVGFRAPGYTITDALFDVLDGVGFAYDSSVFPCPSYYLAKAAAIGGYRLLSRPTHSIVDHPRILRAPADPYRVGSPYSRRGRGLLELPVGVTRDATGRLPYIGTFVMASDGAARALTRFIAGRSLVNLVLHGIDAADADSDGLRELRHHQPDLRRSAAAKLTSLRIAIETLREHGYEFVTLAQAARRLGTAAAA